MPVEQATIDTLAVLRDATRSILEIQLSQMPTYFSDAGQSTLSRMVLLFTLLGGLFLLVIRNLRGIRGALVLLVALGFTSVTFVLDWHQRDLSSRVAELGQMKVRHLRDLPTYSSEVLRSDSVLTREAPRHTFCQKVEFLIPGFYDGLPYIFVLFVLNGMALYLWWNPPPRRRFTPFSPSGDDSQTDRGHNPMTREATEKEMLNEMGIQVTNIASRIESLRDLLRLILIVLVVTLAVLIVK